MNGMAAPATAQLQRAIELALTRGERWRIAVTLGGGLIAAGLFAVGLALEQWGPPERRLIGVMCQALAALVVVLPLAWHALVGLLRNDPASQVEQLVSVAALAALAIGDFYTATLVPLILHLGHFLEERSVLGAQAAVAGLRRLQQRRARVLRGADEVEIDATELRLGDLLVVRPGDVLPADGTVQYGASTLDQASITGESVPVEAGPGQLVFAGTTNLTGLLRVEVTRLGEDTALGRVVHLLKDAEQSKTPVLKLIERYAGVFLLLVLSVAGVVLFLTRDVQRAIAVLVVGCPGPFILAGPSAMVAALNMATRIGVLIKNTKFLESLADVDTVVFDKTGTVTLGELQVVGSRPCPGVDDATLLSHAVRCAQGSRHPVSRAILRAAAAAPSALGDADARVTEFSGRGVQYESNGTTRLMGRRAWLESEGFELPDDPDHPGVLVWIADRHHSGDTQRQPLGALLLADEPRPEARQAIAALRQLGVGRCILLTGDRRRVAEQIGAALQVDTVVSEVLPEDKLRVVDEQKALGRTVAVVGDGINDSLALAAGDVGIAMGALGSDVAIQSSDVVLATSDLSRIPQALALARRTRATIHQNVLVGGAITLGLLAVAAAGWISPIAAAVLHNVGEIYVLTNSARLLRT